MNNRKFLLLGGNGFIGRNLQTQLNKLKKEYIVIDRDDYDMTKKTSVTKLVSDMDDITDIVILASAVGVKIFTEEPIRGFHISHDILMNTVEAIEKASLKYGKKYNVTWLSSSEIYGNTTIDGYITEESPISFNQFKPRSLYSQVKILGESIFNDMYNRKIIKTLTIVRPFNISGRFQKRGLIYEMIKSILMNKTIKYAENTTRTITEVKYFCQQMIKTILENDGLMVSNISDSECSVNLKTIAYELVKILREKGVIKGKITFNVLPYDTTIQYRHTGRLLKRTNSYFHDKMNKIVTDILKDLKND